MRASRAIPRPRAVGARCGRRRRRACPRAASRLHAGHDGPGCAACACARSPRCVECPVRCRLRGAHRGSHRRAAGRASARAARKRRSASRCWSCFRAARCCSRSVAPHGNLGRPVVAARGRRRRRPEARAAESGWWPRWSRKLEPSSTRSRTSRSRSQPWRVEVADHAGRRRARHDLAALSLGRACRRRGVCRRR